jgi:uncharacterized protein YndB with AHSA1/START domain
MSNPNPERSVVTECELPDAPEKVWQALTVPKLLAQWLPDVVHSEILAAEPNRLLRYRWPGSEQDRDAAGRTLESVVTFELTDTPSGGTHLRVVHRVVACASVIAFGRRTATRGEPVALLGARSSAVGAGIAMFRRAA